MEKNEKIQLLESFLRSRGLSLDDPDVKRFFFEQRKTFHSARLENNKMKLAYGPIEPTVYRIDPIQFMNSGYLNNETTSSIMDWLMYSNYEDNPLVFDNLGKDQTEIRRSFEERRRIARPAHMDSEGYVYNGEDGNHRLLSLMINQFVDYASCKNSEERQAVKDKYSLILEVSLPHDKELCDLLETEKNRIMDYRTDENADDFIPYAVRAFRQLHKGASDTYLASYDKQTDTYHYDFNGTKFVGDCESLKNFLKNKKRETMPIMLWSDGKESYLSYNNFVVKSENKQFLEKRLANMRASSGTAKNMPRTSYMIVFDADKERYDITIPSLNIPEGNGKAKMDVVRFLQDFTNNLENNRFFELSEINPKDVEKECDDGRMGRAMYVPETRFENLSAEEYAYVAQILKENEGYILSRLNVLNNADELQVVANEIVELLPTMDFTNESLRSISAGILRNPRTAGAKSAVQQARNTFNFGKTMAQWGYGKLRNEFDEIEKIESDVVRMPQYIEIAGIHEQQQKIEEHFASARVFGEESLGYLQDLSVDIDNSIAKLEGIARLTKNPRLIRIINDLIDMLERDASACSNMISAIYAKKRKKIEAEDEKQ